MAAQATPNGGISNSQGDIGTSISNYDILVEPPIFGMSTEFSLAKHKDHVGNNRLQVFLNMHQQSYGSAHQRGDTAESNRIVDRIVDTVSNQCVPRGRFLVSSNVVVGNGMPVVQWHQMDEQAVKALLHKILKLIETTTASMLATNPPEKAAAPAAVPLVSVSAVFPPPLISMNVDDGQKRRRRSSLLRRSASESMLGIVLDNKKKMNRSGNDNSRSQEEPASWKSARSTGAGLTTLNRMDVILTADRNSLDPNSQSVGNNRLHILVAMRSGNYQQGSLEEREAIIDEVVQTVHTFWKGRFSVDGPEGHEELDKDEARHAIRSIFGLRTGQSKIPPMARFKRHSDPFGGMANFGSRPGMAMGQNMGLNLGGTISTAKSRNSIQGLMQPPSPRPIVLLQKQASNSMIPAGDLADVTRLRSMAIKSLQKQKIRQTIANRLQKMGETNQTLPVFPLGGKMQPPNMGKPFNIPISNATGDISSGNNGKSQKQSIFASAPKKRLMRRKRESTVLGKLDASVMEKLVADFDDADCNDDIDEPLPPKDSNVFGSQFNQQDGSNGNIPFSGSPSPFS